MTELLNKLREHFPEEDLEFRVGATNTDKTMGLALAYVQARAIQNRLDEVLGVENWKVAYKEIQGGFLCTLSIRINNEWISKEDGASTTDYESIKGGISSAFKRVASSGFGIGRYLYNARNSWFPIKPQGKGFVFATTPKLELNDKEPKKEKLPDKIENKPLVLDFGKYKGYTLEEIYKKDISYIKYLRDKSRDVNIIKICERLLGGK